MGLLWQFRGARFDAVSGVGLAFPMVNKLRTPGQVFRIHQVVLGVATPDDATPTTRLRLVEGRTAVNPLPNFAGFGSPGMEPPDTLGAVTLNHGSVIIPTMALTAGPVICEVLHGGVSSAEVIAGFWFEYDRIDLAEWARLAQRETQRVEPLPAV